MDAFQTRSTSVVDLTRLAANAPVPKDPAHPLISEYVMVEDLPQVYDPLRFRILEIGLRQCFQKIETLEFRLTEKESGDGR